MVRAVVPYMVAISANDKPSQYSRTASAVCFAARPVASERDALPMQVDDDGPAVDSERGAQLSGARAGPVGGHQSLDLGGSQKA